MKTKIIKLGPFDTIDKAFGAIEGARILHAKDGGDVSADGDPESQKGEDGHEVWFVTVTITMEDEEPDEEDPEDTEDERRDRMEREYGDKADDFESGNMDIYHAVSVLGHTNVEKHYLFEDADETMFDVEGYTPEHLLPAEALDSAQENSGKPQDDIVARAEETVGDLQEEFQQAEEVAPAPMENDPAFWGFAATPETRGSDPDLDDDEGDGKGEGDSRTNDERERDRLAAIAAMEAAAPRPTPDGA